MGRQVPLRAMGGFLKEWDAQGVFEGGPPPPDRSSLKPWRKSISRAFIDWSVGAQKTWPRS